jgi:hypothetical protein
MLVIQCITSAQRYFPPDPNALPHRGATLRAHQTAFAHDVSIPLGKHLGSASPAEVKLAEIALASIRIPNRSRRGRLR